jgi:anti-sigma factor RsiW
MNCDLASRYLDAFVDEGLEPAVERELEEHLRSCLACQCQAWEIREFRTFFRQHAPRYQAPPKLRARVLTVARPWRAIPSFSLPRPVWLAAAAALVLGILITFSALSPDHGKELAAQAVWDYSGSASANAPVELASANFEVLKPWFATKLGFSPPAIDLRDCGYQLAGGRVAVLEKRSVVALVYTRENDTLVIYCWPPNQDPVSYSNRSINGCSVYTWSNSACNYLLVAKTVDRKVAEFVASFEDQPSATFY